MCSSIEGFYMKRMIIICAIVAMVFSCDFQTSPRIPFGIVHLSVLKEDGTAFKDSEAVRFIVQYSQQNNSKIEKVINEEDRLIFKCSRELQIYREGNEITDDDITRVLDAGQWLAIKDKNREYKTVKKTYKDCYKRHEKASRRSYSDPDYIYYCEVKLEKK